MSRAISSSEHVAEAGPTTTDRRVPGQPPVEVHLPADLHEHLLRRSQELNAAGLKAYGLLVGDPGDPGFPYHAVDVVMFDPHRNRRNEPANRAAFHAQGSYFRAYEDAGFVTDPTDLLRAWRWIERAGLEPVAPFHVHRRQPANFSSIDYRLHNPAFAWHLIISLRDPAAPDIRPYRVRKSLDELGIDETDDLEGSELSYLGPEVSPLGLVLTSGVPSRTGQRVGPSGEAPARYPDNRRPMG